MGAGGVEGIPRSWNTPANPQLSLIPKACLAALVPIRVVSTASPGTDPPLAPVILPGAPLNSDFPGASEVSWLADPHRCCLPTSFLFPSLGRGLCKETEGRKGRGWVWDGSRDPQDSLLE